MLAAQLPVHAEGPAGGWGPVSQLEAARTQLQKTGSLLVDSLSRAWLVNKVTVASRYEEN